jgi:hypothetical protein
MYEVKKMKVCGKSVYYVVNTKTGGYMNGFSSKTIAQAYADELNKIFN